jgi:hypothetical protein
VRARCQRQSPLLCWRFFLKGRLQAAVQRRTSTGVHVTQASLQTWSLLRALGVPGGEGAAWPPVRVMGFSKGCVVVNQVTSLRT